MIEKFARLTQKDTNFKVFVRRLVTSPDPESDLLENHQQIAGWYKKVRGISSPDLKGFEKFLKIFLGEDLMGILPEVFYFVWKTQTARVASVRVGPSWGYDPSAARSHSSWTYAEWCKSTSAFFDFLGREEFRTPEEVLNFLQNKEPSRWKIFLSKELPYFMGALFKAKEYQPALLLLRKVFEKEEEREEEERRKKIEEEKAQALEKIKELGLFDLYQECISGPELDSLAYKLLQEDNPHDPRFAEYTFKQDPRRFLEAWEKIQPKKKVMKLRNKGV